MFCVVGPLHAAGVQGDLHRARLGVDVDAQTQQKAGRQDSTGIYDYGIIFDFYCPVVLADSYIVLYTE